MKQIGVEILKNQIKSIGFATKFTAIGGCIKDCVDYFRCKKKTIKSMALTRFRKRKNSTD